MNLDALTKTRGSVQPHKCVGVDWDGCVSQHQFTSTRELVGWWNITEMLAFAPISCSVLARCVGERKGSTV